MGEENRILWRQEVLGNCSHCGKKNTYALWTVYNLRLSNGEYDQVLRCLSCGTANEFEVTEQDWWKLASKFKPFNTDQDDDMPKYNTGSGRYVKGNR